MENDVSYFRDGDMWCATRPGFINIQESPCGFGDDKEAALKELLIAEELERVIEEAGDGSEEVGAAIDTSDIEM